MKGFGVKMEYTNIHRHNAIINNFLWPEKMVKLSRQCCRVPSSGNYTGGWVGMEGVKERKIKIRGKG